MKGLNNKVIAGLGLALAMAGNAYAAPIVNVSNTDGDLYDTDALTGYQTNGSDMDGMEVTTCFASAACETVTFDGTVGSSSYGEAVGSGWSLSFSGDTFSSPFTYSTDQSITSILLNGRPGNTIFDIVSSSTLSPNSAQGAPFSLQNSGDLADDATVNVEYSDKLWCSITTCSPPCPLTSVVASSQACSASYRTPTTMTSLAAAQSLRPTRFLNPAPWL